MEQISCLEDYEIVVVGRQLDDLRKVYSNYKIVLLKTPFLCPPSKARNLGARKANGDVLIFIDDDCEALPGLIKGYLSYLNDINVGVVTGKIKGVSNRFFAKCLDYSNFYLHLSNHDKKAERFISATFGIRKEVFDSLHGFDENILGEEEVEFAVRLRKLGLEIVYSPKISILHNHKRDTFLKMIRYYYISGLAAGLSLPLRHHNSFKTKVKFNFRYCYIFLVLPSAIWSTTKALKEIFILTKKVFLYAPFIFINHLSYQIGVLKWVFTSQELKSGRI